MLVYQHCSGSFSKKSLQRLFRYVFLLLSLVTFSFIASKICLRESSRCSSILKDHNPSRNSSYDCVAGKQKSVFHALFSFGSLSRIISYISSCKLPKTYKNYSWNMSTRLANKKNILQNFT